MPAEALIHHVAPSTWAFFSTIQPALNGFVGAFFSSTGSFNSYINTDDDGDLPITAILIPY